MGELGGTIGSIFKSTQGPAAEQPSLNTAGSGAPYGGATAQAEQAQGPRIPGGPDMPSPDSVAGTGMMRSFTEPQGTLPPTQGVLSGQTPAAPAPDRLSQLQSGLNQANQVSQGLRGLYSDLSRGPGASPLLAGRAAPAQPFSPTARGKKPMRLSDIMGQR